MAFGGAFAPLPIRLGGSGNEDGWTAAQHSRFSENLAQVKRTCAFAVLTYETVAGVTTYHGENGTGSVNGPTVSVPGDSGDVTFTWSGVYENDYRQKRYTHIVHATATAHGSTAYSCTVDITAANAVRVRVYDMAGAIANPASVQFSLKVWKHSLLPRYNDYGGDLNKKDSKTEGYTAYAHAVLKMLQAGLGNAFTTDSGTWITLRNIAWARAISYVHWRLSEKVESNAVPETADEKLAYWIRILNVTPRPFDTKADLRRKAGARFRANIQHAHTDLFTAVESVINPMLVTIHQNEGTDLETPPEPTYWPDGDAGPAGYDLGGGTWLSARSHVWCEVNLDTSISEQQALSKLNGDLFDELDWRLPAWCTFDWAETDGFVVGESQLDFDGLGD